MPNPEAYGSLDVPYPDSNLGGSAILMSGWAFSRKAKVVSVVAMIDMEQAGYAFVDLPRPDVAAAHPDVPTAAISGYTMEVDVTRFAPGPHDVFIRVNLEGGSFEDIGQRHVNFAGPLHEARRQAIRPLLACPTCHGSLHDEPDTLVCDNCARRTPLVKGVPVFEGGIDRAPPGPLSVSPYGPMAQTIIQEYAGGLVLDCGAGYPTQSFPNVVQFELFRFPSTDVAGDALHLPFADNSFDAVISQAVMEHVTQPFMYGQEMLRVLKPGGKALVDSAFLQPVHAYPHHYFNTTLMGLHEVMQNFELIEEGVGQHQKPWVMLHWVLSRYVAGLSSEQERRAMMDARVGDIIRTLRIGAPAAPFDSLMPQSEVELAAGVYFLGRKPSP